MRCSARSWGAVYSRADRLLHHLALDYRPVLEASFDFERARHGRAARVQPIDRPVFVSGLARAGTSILTRMLHGAGGFVAPSYRDMPFPLAPNGWRALTMRMRRHVDAQERGHGDGLTHDLDSPEAIEEVFWRCTEGARYRTPQGLAPMDIGDETVAAFRDYVALVLMAGGGGRYLSKNNNNVLRLEALVAAFPDAVLLHPFRDPVQQALSLRHQHLRACALAAEDPFRARFMTWLGHHEFGADRRPFVLPGAPAADAAGEQLDYWLGSWIAVYRWLLDAPGAVRPRQIFVDYDRLCRADPRLVARIADAAGIAGSVAVAALQPPAAHPEAEADAGLIAEARAVHARLVGCVPR
ncbi:sulfotransferase [Sphingomonas hengshuiensis]|uniref:sulfotransferase n=1 Tax=Sphingomonas hengshuiensis TaxID=1609977 RepID=UPI000981708C|nr:sulfotransferase [Sphingomonas hengshuiensis]